MAEFIAFTDGASRGNPGPAGWGAIVANKEKVTELGGFIDNGTNNQAELQAICEVLKSVKEVNTDKITVYVDSAYVKQGAESWVHGWSKNGWKTKEGDSIKNKSLWQELFDLQADINVVYKRIKGHSGIPANERADDIATSFSDGESPELYDGVRESYGISLNPNPEYLPNHPVYLSFLDGIVHQHESWEDCKERVHGTSAQYKKVHTVRQRQELLDEWGVSVEDVQNN